MHSIRVINYWGDLDDLHDLIAIGPYPTAHDRNIDMARIASLPHVDGSAQLEPSTLDPAEADYRATPEEVADVVDLTGLIKALYGL